VIQLNYDFQIEMTKLAPHLLASFWLSRLRVYTCEKTLWLRLWLLTQKIIS